MIRCLLKIDNSDADLVRNDKSMKMQRSLKIWRSLKFLRKT